MFSKIIIITGGAGFIGSNFLNRYASLHPEIKWINCDTLTYAGDLANILPEVSSAPNYVFEQVDITDKNTLATIYAKHSPTDVIHFAAESHVDNSILNPSIFLETNILGTNNLLLLHRDFNLNRFHYISTDEVYGDLPLDRPDIKFHEDTPLHPHSPYSVSKASGDMLAQAFHRTYGLDVTISRCSNNYGPKQHKEKLIPRFISQLSQNHKVPLYGDGMNVRDWIHVDDHNDGVRTIFTQAKAGSIYNLGGMNELSNKTITYLLLKAFGKDESNIDFVPDRLGHDRRYAIDCSKIKQELGWSPTYDFEQGLQHTIERYTSQTTIHHLQKIYSTITDQPMKIAIISEGRYPIYGGGQIHVDYLSQILIQTYGYKVDLFTRKIKGDDGTVFDQDETNQHGMRIFRVGPTAIFFNGYLRLICLITMTIYLRRKAKQERYDLIHAHAMLPGLPAKVVGRLLSIPVVYTVHGTMFMDARRLRMSYFVEKLMVCGIIYDAEISVSSKILQYLNRNHNIRIIYNGVDLDKVNAIQQDEKYHKLTFVTVARMDWQKNHQIILDAIIAIGSQFFRQHQIQFVWIGDGLEYNNLTAFIQTHEIGDIVILKGKLDYRQTIIEYKKSHLFLLPSLSEGQPLTVLEAFACGLPVLATDVGDNASFVQDGYNGELFVPRDLQSIIAVITKYATMNKVQIQQIGNHGYQFVQDYTREDCVRKTIICYESLLIKK